MGCCQEIKSEHVSSLQIPYEFRNHFRLMGEQCGLDNDDDDDGYVVDDDYDCCRPPKRNGNHLESEMLSSGFSLTLATGFVSLR
jgi:hypothetical protein